MIELPGPDWTPPEPRGSGGGSRRNFALVVLVLVVLVAMVAALVNARRSGSNGNAGPDSIPNIASTAPSKVPNSGSPNSGGPGRGSPGGGGPGGGGLSLVPAVSCPQIRDELSHLAYQCIDNYLQQDGSDIKLGLRIALNHEVEPGWVISEGSGDPTSLVAPPDTTVVDFRQATSDAPASPQTVLSTVQQRTALALANAYGDNPTARTMSAKVRDFAGVQGYELVTEITMSPAYRQLTGLKARTERLWVVGLPTPSGVSIFMMSIPDARSDLWPRAEATVGTVHVI